MVFEISILDDAYRARRFSERRPNRGAFTEISRMLMKRPADLLTFMVAKPTGLRTGEICKNLRCKIGGSVVNYDYFDGGQELAMGE
jgi:hypothetical protein